jgi:malonyl-CoA O-methyltransferase
LGPDTFTELRQAFQRVDSFAHVNDFVDMHDIGDGLLKASFADPVMDMEHLTALYPSLSVLLHTLKAQGVRNINRARNPGLTRKSVWRTLEQGMSDFCTDKNKFPLTYEVIYGHAWKSVHPRREKAVEAYFPISQLK